MGDNSDGSMSKVLTPGSCSYDPIWEKGYHSCGSVKGLVIGYPGHIGGFKYNNMDLEEEGTGDLMPHNTLRKQCDQ